MNVWQYSQFKLQMSKSSTITLLKYWHFLLITSTSPQSRFDFIMVHILQVLAVSRQT